MANEIIIDGKKVRLYDNMYDYVEDADFGYYEIQDGKIREAPFIEAVKPRDNSDFIIYPDETLVYDGLEYTRVNFGEDDDPDGWEDDHTQDECYGHSYLLSNALGEDIYLIYNKVEGEIADYKANAICYRTEELAYLSGNMD